MQQQISPIEFHYQTRNFSLAERNRLKAFIPDIFRSYRKAFVGCRFIFCSDPYVLDLNRSFLKHDYLTDILTFRLSEPDAPIEGEIYISIDRVRENARSFAQPFYRELHRVVFHGCLHLCGLRDKSKTDQVVMRKAEETWLRRYFVPRATVSSGNIS